MEQPAISITVAADRVSLLEAGIVEMAMVTCMAVSIDVVIANHG